MWEMSQGSGGGAGLHTFALNAARPHRIYAPVYSWKSHTRHEGPPSKPPPRPLRSPMHFGSNYHRQVDDENLTSFELMHDLYQFRMSFTLAIPPRAARLVLKYDATSILSAERLQTGTSPLQLHGIIFIRLKV